MSEQEPGQEQQGQGQQQGPGDGGQGWNRENLTELYETMSRVLRENLERAGSMSEEAFERAMRETRDWADRLRENYGDDINRVTEYLRRDWHAGIRFTRERYRRAFDLDRLQAGALDIISQIAKTAGAQLETFASKINDRLMYKTGEIAGAGSLQCAGCEQVLTFDKATRIPPCPKCHGTSFRRSF